jgi:hypothetical protein
MANLLGLYGRRSPGIHLAGGASGPVHCVEGNSALLQEWIQLFLDDGSENHIGYRVRGFDLIMSVAMAYSAVVQAFIYRTGPCYSHPLACGASDKPSGIRSTAWKAILRFCKNGYSCFWTMGPKIT